MSESTKKITKYNSDILEYLQVKFGYSKVYVYKSLKGDRTGLIPDAIKKEYTRLDLASKKAISSAANNSNR